VDSAAPIVRVFIAAHVRLYRDALAESLAREPGVEVVGMSGDPTEMLLQVRELKPEVVVLDPAVAENLDAVRRLVNRAGEIKVVVLASPATEGDIIACAEAGVSGFVTRDDSLADLVGSIQSAARGDLRCSPQTAGTLLRRVTALATDRSPGSLEAHLTAREVEVAQLIDEGLSNKQIALRLCIELPTVKHHVHHILEKLAVARRSEAVSRLRQVGLLQAVALAEALNCLSL
jgi:two-component system nitrate/nitrite response regulator NarL